MAKNFCAKTCGVCKAAASKNCKDLSTRCKIYKSQCIVSPLVRETCCKTCAPVMARPPQAHFIEETASRSVLASRS